jgi:NAD(P)-dependent dehydrogenase (short-subunit alcohol dehydrogenase family)
LQNQTIVIIGGTGGLGLSAARAFVRHGARVVVVGRDPDDATAAIEALGTTHAAKLVGDATDAATSDRAIALAVERFGRLDGLYHVAGGSGRSKGDGPLHEVADEGINYTIDLNFTSVLYSNRAAVRQFLRQGDGGAVLNMTSVLALSPSPLHFATHVYAAAKAAIIGLTRSAAAYYAPSNIRFNAITPALVETPMSQRAIHDETIREFIRHKQPLDGGRIGTAGDLDDAAVFFLSDASRYVTGQVLAVDGGWSVSEGVPREKNER